MAIKIINDNLMGVNVDSYNRIENIQSFRNGLERVEIVSMKYGSEDYRRGSPRGGQSFVDTVTLTEEEQSIIWDILYSAQKRNYENTEDC